MSNNTHSDTPPPYTDECNDYNWDGKSIRTLVDIAPSSPDLQVTTRTKSCRSGFDYPAELAKHNISEQDWTQFTQAIRDEAKLSPGQWSTVVAKTIGTLAVGGIIVGFFGAVPAAIVGTISRRRQEKRNLAAALAGDEDTPLARHIAHWNDTVFRPHGVLIRVELPEGWQGVLFDRDLHRGDGPITTHQDSSSTKARIVIMVLDGSAENLPRSSIANRAE